jgi:hypothetical protein
MRLASTMDWGQISAMITARELWLRARGKQSHGDRDAVSVLIDNPDDGAIVVALYEDGQVLGCTALLLNASPAGPSLTTAAEEPLASNLVMATTYTNPHFRGERIGLLMTMWVCDYAARLPEPRSWVWCSVPDRTLVRHYRDRLGWQEVRSRPRRGGNQVSLMRRPAAKSPGLPALIANCVPVEAR